MRTHENLDRNEIAAAYRELSAENKRLKPLSDAAFEVSMKFVSGASLTNEDRAIQHRGTEATERSTANTTAMIEMNNELASRGEADLSAEEKGE